MTWMELHLLLASMVAQKHTSLCNTPARVVKINMGDTEYVIDLVESMTTGELIFNVSMNGDNDVD